MTISKAHFQLATNLKLVDILNNPQKYLGPYTDHLLQFWNKLDTLTEDQWKTIGGRYWDFFNNHKSAWLKAAIQTRIDTDKIIGEEFAFEVAYQAPRGGYWSTAPIWATREIIGNVPSPVFLPMFDNL